MIKTERISLNFIKKEPVTGSYNGMRFRLHQQEVENEEEKVKCIQVSIWSEPFCYEATLKEQMLVKNFPLTKEGKEEAVKWMNEQYELDKERWIKAKNAAWI